ncbi:MAG: hypothetical protein ACHBN1_25585 [Heteroscytonema crispum UTEX LB 1556]
MNCPYCFRLCIASNPEALYISWALGIVAPAPVATATVARLASLGIERVSDVDFCPSS